MQKAVWNRYSPISIFQHRSKKRSIEMKGFKKLHLLLLHLNILFLASASQEVPNKSSCGSIEIQEPFIPRNSSSLILCKSEKLYLRASIGLLRIHSINYTNKFVIVSHTSSSSHTRISFDIPDHVPDPCSQCEKPYGNCGVGLRCACHPKKCRDKVISSAALRACGVYLVFFIFFLHGF